MKLDAHGVPVDSPKLDAQIVNLGGGRRAVLQLDALGRYVSHQPHHGGTGGLAALQAPPPAAAEAEGAAAALVLDLAGQAAAQGGPGGQLDAQGAPTGQAAAQGGPGGQLDAQGDPPGQAAARAPRTMEEATAQAAQERPAALDLIPPAVPELAPAPAAGGFLAGT